MQNYLIAFIATLLTTTAITPIARLLAIRLGAVSSPGGRNVNASSIPRLGGTAIALGWCLPLCILFLWHGAAHRMLQGSERQLAGAMGGGLILCVVGAFDDLRGVRAVNKLLA